MLVTHNYAQNEPEANELYEKLSLAGHTPQHREMSETPASVAQIWPMGDHYITETGAMVWPWVMYPGRGGYYLKGAAPLSAAPPAAQNAKVSRAARGMDMSLPPSAPTPAEISQIRLEDRARAAAQCVLDNVRTITRTRAAALYGVRLRAVKEALSVLIPRRTKPAPGKAAQAARWFVQTEGASRKDASVKFNVSLSATQQALARDWHPDMIPHGRPGLDVSPTPLIAARAVSMAARWAFKEGQTVRAAAARYGCSDRLEDVLDAYNHLDAAWSRKHRRG